MVAPIQPMNGYLLPAGNIFASEYCYHLYHLDDILFFGRVSTIEGTTVLSSELWTLPHFWCSQKGIRQLSHSSVSWLTLELQLPENEQLWSSKQSSTSILLSCSTDFSINPIPHSVSALLVVQMSDWSRGLTPATLTSYESGKHCFFALSSHFSFQ